MDAVVRQSRPQSRGQGKSQGGTGGRSSGGLDGRPESRQANRQQGRARAPKLTRAERQEQTRQRLFDAAARIVGRSGYASASIVEITRQAGVALGTFYNYFGSRQDLLDQLLPVLGEEMLAHIRARVTGIEGEIAREEARLRAFFEFLMLRPEFYRILHEAEQQAPAGFRRHMRNIEGGYVNALKKARTRGAITGYSDEDLEVASCILMAARDYLAMNYLPTRGRMRPVPDGVVEAYMRLLTQGLFNGPGAERPRNGQGSAG